MIRTGRVLWCGLLALAVIGLSSAAETEDQEYCTGDGPECVLDCIETAHDAMDLQLYGNLISADFRYVMGDGDAASWGREEELASAKAIFENPEIASFHVTFLDGHRVVAGPEEDTWVIENIQAVMEILGKTESSSDYRAEKNGLRLSVRKVENPVPHFEVFQIYEPTDSGKLETKAGESGK